MAEIPSAATGDAHVGATWTGGVAPGAGDVGRIDTGHTVTVATGHPMSVLGFKINGGTLVQNDTITYSDSASAGLQVTDTNSGGFSSGGIPGTWMTMKSAATDQNKPTYPWEIDVDQIDGTDSRSLDFRYVQMTGLKWYLGNTHYHAHPNDPGDPGKLVCDDVDPATRENRVIEHPIKGRTSSRIYPSVISAAGMTLSGSCHYTSGFPFILDNIQKAKQRISFFSRWWHLPKCQIDGKPIIKSRKGEYLDWSVVLREDV